MGKILKKINMKEIDTNIIYSIALFLICFRVYFLSESMIYTLFDHYRTYQLLIITAISYGLLIFKIAIEIIYKKTNSFKFIVLLIFLIFVIVLENNSNCDWILNLWIFILCGNGVKEKNIIIPILLALLITIVPTAILSFFGIIENITKSEPYGLAYSMGFYNPNTFASLVFMIIMMFFYLKKDDIKLWMILIAFLVNICLWIITQSRTYVYSMTLVLVLLAIYCLFLKGKANVAKLSRVSMIFAFIVFAGVLLISILVVACPELFKEPFYMKRFGIADVFFQTYKPSFFGQEITKVQFGSNVYNLDMGYLHSLLKFGPIYTSIIIILYVLLFIYEERKRNVIAIIIITAFIMCGFTETSIIRWRYNFTLFLFAPLIWQNSKYKIQKIVDNTKA